jgi:hypothetical protein
MVDNVDAKEDRDYLAQYRPLEMGTSEKNL